MRITLATVLVAALAACGSTAPDATPAESTASTASQAPGLTQGASTGTSPSPSTAPMMSQGSAPTPGEALVPILCDDETPATAADTTSSPPDAAARLTRPASVQCLGSAPNAVHLSFSGGVPTEATMLSLPISPGGDGVGDPIRTASDGTPLGYLTSYVVMHGGPPGPNTTTTYLWDAVGPDITGIDVRSSVPTDPARLDPGVSTAEQQWTFGADSGSSSAVKPTAWTDLDGGWHAFAVAFSLNADAATITALGDAGRPLQSRRFDFETGRSSDTTPASTRPTH